MTPVQPPVPDDRIRSLEIGDNHPPQIWNAYLILGYTHESATALLDALRLVRKQRPAKRGALTDEEQDLLRAMLVMAASGLDAMTKQIIRDILPTLCLRDEAVAMKFVEFAARQIRGDAEGIITGETSKLLAKVLTGDSPKQALIEEYIGHLTGGSLQSVEELYKVTAALTISPGVIDRGTLQPIFKTRNAIVHELDIDFSAPRRNRNSRPMGESIAATNRLLQLAEGVFIECEKKLNDVESEV